MQIGHQGKKILKQMFWALTPLRAIKEMGGFHVSILQEKMRTINQKLRKILHEKLQLLCCTWKGMVVAVKLLLTL